MQLNTEFMVQTFWDALAGVPVTLEITLVALIVAFPVGFWMALHRMRGKGVGNRLVSLYISLMRSTPIVLQIMFFYSLLPTLLNYLLNTVWELDVDVFGVNPIVYAFAVFSLNTIAVLSEVFRSSLLTIGAGQMEAALCAGLSSWQAYIRIIIPQALVSAMPNICNTTVSLLKSTSLAFLMTVKDITAIAKMKAAYGYNYIEAYLVIFFVYIILCTLVQLLFKQIEVLLSRHKGQQTAKPTGNRKLGFAQSR
ncbi:MAG: amino acid ABC transporter permease [Clostridiales bacterium]|nr:amino acid ABC transporter permease [Clostridiales bacterium]